MRYHIDVLVSKTVDGTKNSIKLPLELSELMPIEFSVTNMSVVLPENWVNIVENYLTKTQPDCKIEHIIY